MWQLIWHNDNNRGFFFIFWFRWDYFTSCILRAIMKIIDYQFAITMYCLLIFKVKPCIYYGTLCMFVWLCFFFFCCSSLAKFFSLICIRLGGMGRTTNIVFVYCLWSQSSQVLLGFGPYVHGTSVLNYVFCQISIHLYVYICLRERKVLLFFFKLKNMTSVINRTDNC